MHLLKTWLLTTAIFLAIDLTWLGFIAKNFYQTQLSKLLIRDTAGNFAPIWWAALLVYIVIPTGLVLFVLPKITQAQSFLPALAWGAAFGAISYAIYDLTNYSTLQGWPLKVVIADTLWGAIVCGLSSIAMFYISKWLS